MATAMRPKMTDYIPHRPTPPQQAFLFLNCLEALYGGAAGGGKSDALLMGALQWVDTPGYAAPAQYHGKLTLGPWTDIYAVGACMYAALAGGAPQAADARLIDDQLLPARQVWGSEYSPHLLATIDQCLGLDPARRPQHARALQASLAGDEARDQPPDTWLSLLGLGGRK